MRSVATIEWVDISDGGVVVGTTNLEKALGDWTVSADGRSITISGAKMFANPNWFALAGTGDRFLRLFTYAGRTVDTSTLNTAP